MLLQSRLSHIVNQKTDSRAIETLRGGLLRLKAYLHPIITSIVGLSATEGKGETGNNLEYQFSPLYRYQSA